MCSCAPTFAPSSKLSYYMSKLSLNSNKKTEASPTSVPASEPNYVEFINKITKQAKRQLNGCEDNAYIANKDARVMCWIKRECEYMTSTHAAHKIEHRIAKCCQNLANFVKNKETSTCKDVLSAGHLGAIEAVVDHYNKENKQEQLQTFLKTVEYQEDWKRIKEKVILFNTLSQAISQLNNPTIEIIKQEARKLTTDPDLVDEITFFYTQ